jgi:hypothetical protein
MNAEYGSKKVRFLQTSVSVKADWVGYFHGFTGATPTSMLPETT